MDGSSPALDPLALLRALAAIRVAVRPVLAAARDLRNDGRHPNTPVVLTLAQCRAIAAALPQEEYADG